MNLKNCWPLAHFSGITNLSLGSLTRSDRPVCAATEARLSLEILDIESREMILFRQRKTKVMISLHSSAAELCLCISHIQKTGFPMMLLICIVVICYLFI